MSANKKMEALSNPDMLCIEESLEEDRGKDSCTDADQVSAYKQLRISNIQRNRAIFESLGLAGGARKLLHGPLQSRSSKAEDEQDSEMDSDQGPCSTSLRSDQ